MRSRKTTVALSALAAALLLGGAACGGNVAATTPDPTTSTTEPTGSDLQAVLVALQTGSSVGRQGPPVVLRTPEAVDAWLGWFAVDNPGQAAALRADLDRWGSPDDERVLVALPALGCGEEDARLVLNGSDLRVELFGGQQMECFVAVAFSTVFAVDPAALPADLTLQGQPVPEQAGPGQLVEFYGAGVFPPASNDPMVLDLTNVEAWVSGLTSAGIDVSNGVASAIDEAGPEDRVVAAAVQGCAAEGAELVIGPGATLRVALVGPGDILCDAPETYVTVFLVPADLLPNG